VSLADQIVIELVRELSSAALSGSENDTDLILAFVKEIYLNKSISSTQLLQVVYMGQRLVFKVTRVLATENPDTLIPKLESLNLTNGHVKNGTTAFKLYLISSETRFSFTSADTAVNAADEPGVKETIMFKDLGGLEKEIELCKEIFVDPFKYSAKYKEVGVEFSKGVILYGPSGCGKTMLANAILNESGCNFIQLNVSEIYSRFLID
jgi:putative ribosome biogenesis GTPase RsgA